MISGEMYVDLLNENIKLFLPRLPVMEAAFL
jgi:hypothetical protein